MPTAGRALAKAGTIRQLHHPMPLSVKTTGPNPASVLAWQILAPVTALFVVLVLVSGLAARQFFEPLAMDRDLLRAEHYAKFTSVVFAERLAKKTPRELSEEFRAGGLGTLEFLPPSRIPTWSSPRYLPGGPYVEAWAAVEGADGSLLGALIIRRQAEAVVFVTKAIRAFAIASCITFALLLSLAWLLFKRRVTDRLGGIVREIGAAPSPHAGSDAVEQTREAIVEALANTRKSELHLRRFLEGHTELACIRTTEGKIIDVNEACCRCFGKERNDLIGTSYLDLMQPAFRMEALNDSRSLSSAKPEIESECAVTLPDGKVSWIRWRDTAVLGPDGKVKEILSFGTDITSEKKIEEQLDGVRRAFDQMQSLAETGSLTWDLSRDRMEWTPETRRLLGLDASLPASLNSFLAVVAPDDREIVRRLFLAAREEGRAFQHEFRAVLPDGSTRVLQSRAEVLADPKTKILNHLTCTLRDITALRDAEAATKRELRFREAIEQSLASGIAAGDDEGRILLVNSAFCEMTGWTKEELLGLKPPYPYWPEEEMPAIRQALQSTFEGRSPAEGHELRFCHKDGTRFDVLIRVAPLLDENDRRLGWLGSFTDISSIQKVRRELQQAESKARSELLYRQAIEQSLAAGIVASDETGRNLLVNPAFCEMTGMSKEELVGATPPYPYWPEEEIPAINKAFELAIQGKTPPAGFELKFRRKDGTRFDVLVKVAPLLESNNKRLGWLAVVSDISSIQQTRRELAKTETALREQLAFREAVEKSTTVGLIAIGADGRPLSANETYCKMLGYTEQEILQMSPPYPLWPDEDREEIERAFAKHLAGKIPPEGFQLRFRKKNGSLIDVLITAAPIIDAHGKQIATLSALTDITLLQETKRRLQLANEHLQTAQDIAAFGIWEWDPATGVLRWDRQSFAIFGHPEADDARSVWRSLHSEGEQERLTDKLDRLIATGGTSGQDRFRVRWPDGSVHDVLSTYVILRDAKGTTRVLGVNRDVTSEMEEETELRNAQERLAAALEGGNFGTFEHVIGVGDFNYNPANYDINGIDPSITDPAELFAAWQEITGAFFPQLMKQMSSLPRTQTNHTYEFTARPPGKEARRVRVSVFIERDKQGQPMKLVGVTRRID